MPSIIPSYVYSLFATIIVGTLIIATSSLCVSNVKAQAETQQLSNVAGYVATESLQLLSNSAGVEFMSKVSIDVPASIGNQRFWIQLFNESSSAWVGAGIGINAVPSTLRVCIPSGVQASGVYVSGTGPAFLKYQSNSSGTYLTLYGGN